MPCRHPGRSWTLVLSAVCQDLQGLVKAPMGMGTWRPIRSQANLGSTYPQEHPVPLRPQGSKGVGAGLPAWPLALLLALCQAKLGV